MHRKSTIAAVAAGVMVLTSIAQPVVADNPGTGTLSTGDTIEIVIDAPITGEPAPPVGDDLVVSGRTNIPEVPTNPAANVVYVVDVSGSTGGPRGQDCNGDGTLDAGDDLNGDSSVGDTLDCEIQGIIALNDSLGNSAAFDGGLVAFGSSSAVADVGGITDGAITTFTSPLTADISANGQPDLDDVATSLVVGSVGLFEQLSVGGGTNFNSALQTLVAAFGGQPAGEANVAYFLSDGQASVSSGPGSALQSAIDFGIIVNTYSVGGGTAGCGSTASLGIIANATGGSCTIVVDPSALASALTSTPPLGIDRVEVTLNAGAPRLADIDAFGNWSTTFPAADVPAAPIGIVATVFATDGTEVSADIGLIGGAVCTGVDRSLDVGFPRINTQRAFQCRLYSDNFEIWFNVAEGEAIINGETVQRAAAVKVKDKYTWNESAETITKGENQVPDYIDQIAHSLEQAWDTYVNKLGFDPPSDTPSGRVLVAIWDIADFGFVTSPGGFTIPGIISMKPNRGNVEYLARHEFFHTVQWQYGISPGIGFLGSKEHGFLELSAEWAAHRSMQVDPLSSISRKNEDERYFGNLDLFLTDSNYGSAWGYALGVPNKAYGKFIFAEYMETHLGTDSIREVWEGVRDYGSLPAAMTEVLPITDVIYMSDGSAVSSSSLLHDFAVANYYVDRSVQLYDGSFLPFEYTYNDADVDKWNKLADLKPHKIDVIPIATSDSISGGPLRLFEDGGTIYYELETAGWKGGDIDFRLNELRNEGIDIVWGTAEATLIVCDKPVSIPMNRLETVTVPKKCKKDLVLILTNIAIDSDIIVDMTIFPL